ncbi:MAG: DUF2283 domain-containing protein [Proteobacteria bacterium]|nr:DUF2283 domain-containing protein [Pseudomonadota bacterium]
MAGKLATRLDDYVRLVPAVKQAPDKTLWLTYDPEADVLYVNYRKPSRASDSELTDDDVIVRYDGDDIIGLTILHAGHRTLKQIDEAVQKNVGRKRRRTR